jgi:hypothetical protein
MIGVFEVGSVLERLVSALLDGVPHLRTGDALLLKPSDSLCRRRRQSSW